MVREWLENHDISSNLSAIIINHGLIVSYITIVNEVFTMFYYGYEYANSL